MTSVKRCVFGCAYKDIKITIFQEDKLQKCTHILKIRAAYNLKYSDIVLPARIDDINGYHHPCYKAFTSIHRKYVDKYDASIKSERPENATSQLETPSSIYEKDEFAEPESLQSIPMSVDSEKEKSEEVCEVNETDTCFFCNKSRKRQGQKTIHLVKSCNEILIEKIVTNASALNDHHTLSKIEALGTNRVICYHNNCKLNYFSKRIAAPERKESDWHITRNINELVDNDLFSFITVNTIKLKQCYSLKFLVQYTKNALHKLFAGKYDKFQSTITSNSLLQKVEKKFGKELQVIQMHNQKIIAPREGCIISDKTFSEFEETEALQRAAFILRKKLLSIERKPLPPTLTTSDLIKGECVISEDILQFLRSLICGNDPRTMKSCSCARKVDSIAQDLVYAVHHGKIKTSKQITLGMTMKSITSSRKVVDLLNKYGQCCSYNTIEELETEATFSTLSKSVICPEDILLSPCYSTGVAFDNYDRFVETCSGKDTLHDTVGIIYQNVQPSFSGADESQTQNAINPPPTKRRRTFEAISTEIVPYTKKPKLTEKLLPLDSDLRVVEFSNYNFYEQLDVTWMISHYLKIANTPMWVGYNSRIIDDQSIQQKVSYLTPINVSPTNVSVVYETMRQSQKIAEECSQQYIQVTYDLAIAKVAYQIQSTEKPQFNNLFIHLGGFHVMMAYFKALGKFIDGCGLTHIMVESGLLASGSVNGFLSGKHFNRCKRLHPLVAVGLETLLFEQFLTKENKTIDVDLIEIIKELQETTLSNYEIENRTLNNLINEYLNYKAATLNGGFGKTVQFYAMYINFVNYYLMFSRSIRVGDFELYKKIIPKLANLFFIFNQGNYSRWLLKYHDDLLKVHLTHPGLQNDFKNGFFGVKRTQKKFSKNPIDLTLEQTVNASASRRLTGITHFTNSITARQRWAKSHGIRSTIVSYTYDIAGLKKAQDITGDLEKHQIKQDSTQLHTFINMLKQNINPFNSVDSNQLYNIATGRAASQEVCDFLLNVEKNGHRLRETFISECAESDSRFELTIKQNKILNFAAYTEKKMVRVNNKIQEVRLQRDLFGRMLAISMNENTNIEKILTYPLTPVPMSMCHLDGSIFKTDKSTLFKSLERDVESKAPTYTDICLIDGFFLIQCIKDLPKTFGNVSKKILQMVTNVRAREIHLIFDRYWSPSIKDYERSNRGATFANRMYVISGPEQTRPADFVKELRNSYFKVALVNFLIVHWQQNDIIPFLGNKKVLLNFDQCYQYEIVNEKVSFSINDKYTLECHEEADTKIVYHACNVESTANITIKCSDTDILIIMLANMKYVQKNNKIWIQTGLWNKQRIIDVSALYDKLAELFCKSLAGFHALTGCDYNPALFRKGKTRPLQILRKSEDFQKAFDKIGYEDCDTDAVFPILEKFICKLYSLKTLDSVNNVRFALFLKTYKVNDLYEPFQKKRLHNFDASSLPPCHSELTQHLLRSWFIATVWRNAHKKIPTRLNPENCGWIIADEKYTFKWFDGQQLPSTVKDVISEETIDDDDADIDSEEDSVCESEDLQYDESDVNSEAE